MRREIVGWGGRTNREISMRGNVSDTFSMPKQPYGRTTKANRARARTLYALTTDLIYWQAEWAFTVDTQNLLVSFEMVHYSHVRLLHVCVCIEMEPRQKLLIENRIRWMKYVKNHHLCPLPTYSVESTPLGTSRLQQTWKYDWDGMNLWIKESSNSMEEHAIKSGEIKPSRTEQTSSF